MTSGGPTYQFEQRPEYCDFTLKPAMNEAPWSEIERAGDSVLQDLQNINPPHLIVDLTELDYIGSAMVALLVRIWKIVKAKNGRMIIVNDSEMVMQVFKISRLDEVLPIVEDRDDALYQMGVSPEAKIERRESRVLVWASLFAALVGAVVLGVYLAKPKLVLPDVSGILIYGCSAVGAILGLILLLKSDGGGRIVGIASMLIGCGVLIAAGMKVPIPFVNAQEKPAVDDSEPKAEKKDAKPPKPAIAEKPKPRGDAP